MANNEARYTLLCAVILAVLSLGPELRIASAMSKEKGFVMQADESIHNLIESVAQLSKIDEKSVGVLFGIRLETMNDPGNPFIKRFIGLPAESSIVESLELRLPREQDTRGKSLLILTIKPGTGTIAGLRQDLGAPDRIEQPRAAQPLGTPTYEIFDYTWGLLSIGYLPAENDRISEVIFERK